MLRAARSAWVAMRRPTVLGATLVAAAAFALLSTAVTFTSATDEPSAQTTGPGPQLSTTADLALPDGLLAGLANAMTFLGIVAIVVGASALASDYQHGTIRTLLVRQPDRLRLLAGKVLAVVAVLALAGLTATVVAVGAALALAGTADVDTTRWAAGEAGLGALRTTVAVAGYGLLGCALGLAMRSPVAAIGIGVAWVLAIEQIITAAWEDAASALPGQLLTAVAEGSAAAGEVAAAVAWAAVALVVCATLLLRRDVTG